MGKIILTGVDGNFGSFVANSILSKRRRSELVFTSPNFGALGKYQDMGIDCRHADYNESAHLPDAFAGGDTLLLISVPQIGEKRRDLHKNAIDAAKSAGVKQIVYTSICGTGDSDNQALVKVDHEYTENYIRQIGGMDFKFLRNSQYAEAMLTMFEEVASRDGVLRNNMGDGKMALVSRNDCAEAATHAVIGSGEWNTVYYITGPELLSMAEFVKIGSEVTGCQVTYQSIDDEGQYAVFDSLNVPRTDDGDFTKSVMPFCSDDMVSFGVAIREDKMSYLTDDFYKLTGKRQKSVRKLFQKIENHRIGTRTIAK